MKTRMWMYNLLVCSVLVYILAEESKFFSISFQKIVPKKISVALIH